jgi:hypothetical protein
MSSQPRDPGDTKGSGLDSGRNIALQWFGLLGPAAAWLLNLEFGYSLAQTACHGGGMVPVHLLSVTALILAALGGAAALVTWRRSGSDWPDDVPGTLHRSRMFAALGLGSAALFLLIIITQWISAFVLNPCFMT